MDKSNVCAGGCLSREEFKKKKRKVTDVKCRISSSIHRGKYYPRTPAPDPHLFDNELNVTNAIMSFRAQNIRSRDIHVHMQRKAVQARYRLERSEDFISNIDVGEPSKADTHQILLCSAELIRPPEMTNLLQRDIYNRIPDALRNKYSKLLEDLMEETRNEFDSGLHELGVHRRIRPDESGGSWPELPAHSFRHKGRTENYHLFLERRKYIYSNLFPLRKFVRKIYSSAVQLFGNEICDYSQHRNLGQTDHSKLRSRMTCELFKGAQIITEDWYPKIISGLTSELNSDTFPKTMRSQFIHCVKGFCTLQVTEFMRRTIEHLLQVLANPNRAPLLKVYLFYDEDICEMYPSLNDISILYHGALKQITQVAQNMQSPEKALGMAYEKEFLIIKLEPWYLEEAHERLNKILYDCFHPMEIYSKAVYSKYEILYSKETKEGIVRYLSEEHTFEEGSQIIKIYKNIIEELRGTVMNEYFPFGKVVLGDYINTMMEFAENIVNQILKGMILDHKRANLRICAEFEELKEFALRVPESAEQLMESGARMVWANTEFLEEVRDRIAIGLDLIVRLMEMTTISEDHIYLNAQTVNWLTNIKPILEINSTNYESYKFEFEERLQRASGKLNDKLVELVPFLSYFDSMDDLNNVTQYIEFIRKFVKKLAEFDEDKAWINNEETLFKFQLTEYPLLDELRNYIMPFYDLIYMCYKWQRNYYTWMDGPFEYLNGPFVEQTTEENIKEVMRVNKVYKNKIRQDILESQEIRFKGIVDDPHVDNQPAPLKLCTSMLDNMQLFRQHVPIVSALCNPDLKQRHWDEMSNIVGFDITPNAGTTLRKMIRLKFGSALEKFEVISIGACKEQTLHNNLQLMISEWKGVMFNTILYKDTNLTILTGLDDVQAILEDHLTKTLSMRGSAFVKPFLADVRSWYEKLCRVNATIDEWGKVQSQWLYFLPIFSSVDIAIQMEEEANIFSNVNDTYRKFMDKVDRNPRVIATASMPELLENLRLCTEQLEKVNEGVNLYLEKKRIFFSRLFFLSNNEMIEILSETKDPTRVQPHLKKCFEGIDALKFDSERNIHSMRSRENEEILFSNKISTAEAGGSVEKWFAQVEQRMLTAVKEETELCFVDYDANERTSWIMKWPEQIILSVSQIIWANDVHRAMATNNVIELETLHNYLTSQLENLVKVLRSPILDNLSRNKIHVLIVLEVNAKDIVKKLIDKNIVNDTDFHWLSQLRYYRAVNKDVEIKLINATVRYANEYMGNSERLVITPLTKRCYRTLINAYHQNLNGAPEGPAGTGKTETVKDLAKAVAVRCIIINCSDSIDFKAMGKFLKGLSSSGAWACFDEFNRIHAEVLSVVAQQILTIAQAIRSHAQKLILDGTELILTPTCFVCITMNPDYRDRAELPDNLKVLFRTIAMMIPDCEMISEVSLLSYGFMKARELSVKLVTAYRLCSEMLPARNFYDYGLRAVKTMLKVCGDGKRDFPNENEDLLVMKAIIQVNLSKFLTCDTPQFYGIITDLFPNLKSKQQDYSILTKGIQECCREMRLIPKESMVLKVIQIYEVMIVRHGLIVIGETFSGKSTALKLIAKTLTNLSSVDKTYNATKQEVINPKSVTLSQLYGTFDPVTGEWIDGIVARILREFTNDESPSRKWIVFDGPIDSMWIENMNTVLDENKKLCLISGEVITMTSLMSMIFEVVDLAQASPATVSRCGMIYMESTCLEWHFLLESWIVDSTPTWKTGNEELISMLFNWVLPPALNFVRNNCTQLVKIGEMNAIFSTIKIFEMLLNDACRENEGDDVSKFIRSWFQAALVTSVAWGIGGVLDTISRARFDEFYKEIWRGTDEANPVPDLLEKIDIAIPNEGLLMDYLYLYKMKGSWKSWAELIKSGKPDEGPGVMAAVIPTVDTGKYNHQLELHIRHKIPMLLVGPTGTGKSFYIQHQLLNRLSEMLYEPGFITFTSEISANQTQELIISKLQKKKRGLYGPTKGKSCVLFVDDLHIPVKDKYGSQPPIEVIRQYFDHGHWYDLKETNKVFVKDILFLGAMGTPGGSKQEVYPRFLRHFCIYSINEFSDESIQKIFSLVLLNGLKKNGFPTDVMTQVTMVVAATLDVYKSAIRDLLPTPNKLHYIFNLRDIAKVIQGCALMRKESAENRKIFAKLWVHETLRVFGDRLVCADDRNWLLEKIQICIQDHFKDKLNVILENYVDDDGEVTMETLRQLMFSTIMDADSPEGERKYEEIPNTEVFTNIANSGIKKYNETNKSKLNMVLFGYSLEHLSKLCRTLSIPSGNTLMMGVGGCGMQSLTRLATSIMGYKSFQTKIDKNYDMKAWRNDLKEALKYSGGSGKDLVFLFTESQIKKEEFLQDLDCLLKSGEIPNLYAVDEKQEILELVRLAAQGGNRNLDISPLQVFSYFINRVKAKLHIILCFSPIGSKFRDRLRLYPSMVNCCTINWMEDWPEESLAMVAQKFITDTDVTENVKECIVTACRYFHSSAQIASKEYYNNTGRKSYVTSASYLDLLNVFSSLIKSKQNETRISKCRYVVGLAKLAKASEAVNNMQAELSELKPQLVDMADKSIQMMKEIEVETLQAERATDQVKNDERVANVQAAKAQDLKRECEADLALAIPILEEALKALNTLKPADIVLVKSMKNPPDTVKLVMAAVCVIKGIAPDRIPDPSTGKKILDYWGPSKKLLGEMTFLQQLKDFDKDNIPEAYMDKIRKEYLPNKVFKPEVVAKASSAAEGLCKWIIAMDLYDDVAKVVGPKKAKLEQAEKDFAATMSILNEKRALAYRLDEKVAVLNASLEEANIKKQKLEDEVELCTNKLFRAEKLINSLGGEQLRWSEAANKLQKIFDTLAGDILISSGLIAYLSPLDLIHRTKCIDDWKQYCDNLKIPCSKEYSFATTLGSDIQIRNWYINGLPKDTFSTDNAVIQERSCRWSLMLDPQIQANKWIKSMEKMNEIQVINFTYNSYVETLSKCIVIGRPVLIENIGEELEIVLDPLLGMHTFKQGDAEYISFGDNILLYNKTFRLYLTSKLRNPHYLPEVFNKVTIINFSLTEEGLEDQLLGIIVTKERPDLQSKRQALIMQAAANKAALKDFENKMLLTLSESKGDILEDESAIDILDSSKLLSNEILRKQEAEKEAHSEIDKIRSNYSPIAIHSTNLYYCITNLPDIDLMYQFSLNWFINLYVLSIETSNRSKHLERRLTFLRDTFTYNLYCNITRSLFEKDKLLFSFMLCTKLKLATGEIKYNEFMFLLGRRTCLENVDGNPDKEWLSQKSWDEICCLDNFPNFQGIKESFRSDTASWKLLYEEKHPQDLKFPASWQTHTSDFQKLIVLRIIRPDKITVAIKNFVEMEMGAQFVKPPAFNIAASYDESNCLSPLIFILSPGSDPIEYLIKYAAMKSMSDKFSYISLGQAQGNCAKSIIKKAQEDGGWVCLQNCHLAPSWMPKLEKIWDNMSTGNTHLEFRMWLTTYPSDKFPTSILQNGVKMTNETPIGLKANLFRSYQSEPIKDPIFFTGCSGKDRQFTKLLYGICFTHAVIQERRKFGPLGWNIDYDFNESDLQISVRQLQMFINEFDDLPLDAIFYVIGECNYGGRVIDIWDRRCLLTILEDFVNLNIVSNSNYLLSNIAPQYGLPRKCEYHDYINHIGKVPGITDPEVLGLNNNAGITNDKKVSMQFLNSMLLVQGKTNHTSISFDTSYQDLLVRISDIISKMPESFDLKAIAQKHPLEYLESINSVIYQELESFNKLLNEIRCSLSYLERSIRGVVVMTEELEALAHAILNEEVPKNWMNVSYPSLKKLAPYIDDFLDRLTFFKKWCFESKPQSFWLSAFFFPQAFLTATKQNYARKYSVPIHTLTFEFEVKEMETATEEPVEGVYVHGLFVVGARWNKDIGSLDEEINQVLYDKMPIILIKPISLSDFDEGSRYKCPLYKTSERKGTLSTTGYSTNFVIYFLLPTEKPARHWIKRSVALLCQLDI